MNVADSWYQMKAEDKIKRSFKYLQDIINRPDSSICSILRLSENE
jgi:hypothetical protein